MTLDRIAFRADNPWPLGKASDLGLLFVVPIHDARAFFEKASKIMRQDCNGSPVLVDDVDNPANDLDIGQDGDEFDFAAHTISRPQTASVKLNRGLLSKVKFAAPESAGQ